ncbi:hypothetical protein SAY87_002877 [Trapa incisa]|uniref:Uncharacterized protein n=1 Tax=Trapa incisa TaxID=236973 RepID=A0AAN7KPE3_9MYRT|nr:hypothetical protein SAY87_002877 [Trapa incisa]
MYQKLGSLKDLHESISDWVQLSQTQQVLSNQNNKKSAECLLDGSLGTLDVCGTLQDIASEMGDAIRNSNHPSGEGGQWIQAWQNTHQKLDSKDDGAVLRKVELVHPSLRVPSFKAKDVI